MESSVGHVKERFHQCGGAMVEFAFVFPLLFLLIYGIIVYSYIFVLQESINFAAQEAAASAVAVDPRNNPAFDAVVIARVRNTAVSVLRWLPNSQSTRVLGSNGDKVQVTTCAAGSAGCPPDSDGVIVKLVFDVTQPTSLFPTVTFGGFMGINEVPPMPTQLKAQATVRI